MIPVLFYLLAILLMGASRVMKRNTTALGRIGGQEYEKRRKRKVISFVLLVIALISLMLGGLNQMFSTPVPPEYPEVNYTPPPPMHPTIGSPLPQAKTPALSQTPMLDSNSMLEAARAADSTLSEDPNLATESAATNNSASKYAAPDPQANHQGDLLLQEAQQLYEQDKTDSALGKLNDALVADPGNSVAHNLRGTIYAQKKLWEPAEQDFLAVLKLEGESSQIRFDVAELQFTLKKYDDARTSFAMLKSDSKMADIAAYKIYLCDLLDGHPDAAARELDAFNRVGSGASYYFANAGSCFYNHKQDDAQDWLKRASYIFPPNVYSLYADSLKTLGKTDLGVDAPAASAASKDSP